MWLPRPLGIQSVLDGPVLTVTCRAAGVSVPSRVTRPGVVIVRLRCHVLALVKWPTHPPLFGEALARLVGQLSAPPVVPGPGAGGTANVGRIFCAICPDGRTSVRRPTLLV